MTMNRVANRSKPQAILFLGTNFRPDVVDMIHAWGYQYLSINRHVGLREAQHVDGAIMCDLNDDGAVHGAVKRLGERWCIEALLSFNEYRVEAASLLAQELGLPHPSGVSQVRFKHHMRQALRDHGVPVPHFATVRDPSEVDGLKREFALPVVVKPVNDSGSRQVRLCHSWVEVAAAVDAVLTGQNLVKSNVAKVCLVEEFVPGPEYSVECFTWQGETTVVAITEKLTTAGPTFVELQHVIPAALSRNQRDQVANAAIRAITSAGLDNTVSHVEVRWNVNRHSPYIIEINPRPGGDSIPDLVYAVTGWNLHHVAVEIALGKDPVRFAPPAEPSANTAGIRFFCAETPGVCVYPGDLGSQLEIREWRMFTKSGRRVVTTEDNFTRLGYMLVCATNRQQLETIFQHGLQLVSITG